MPPEKYLWAGIGDTMAKFYECTTSACGDNDLDHSTSMGVKSVIFVPDH